MKYLLPLACLVLLTVSCKDKSEVHNDSYVQAKVDSIVGSKLGEINSKAMEDLDQRMTIEVKAKADSIVAARKQKSQAITPSEKKPPKP